MAPAGLEPWLEGKTEKEEGRPPCGQNPVPLSRKGQGQEAREGGSTGNETSWEPGIVSCGQKAGRVAREVRAKMGAMGRAAPHPGPGEPLIRRISSLQGPRAGVTQGQLGWQELEDSWPQWQAKPLSCTQDPSASVREDLRDPGGPTGKHTLHLSPASPSPTPCESRVLPDFP